MFVVVLEPLELYVLKWLLNTQLQEAEQKEGKGRVTVSSYDTFVICIMVNLKFFDHSAKGKG